MPQIRTPKSLKAEGRELIIEWKDGVTHRLTWAVLREMCPCATCRMKRQQPPAPPTSLQVLSPQEAQPINVAGMRPIGNYAYGIEFSDGHNSGIYSLDFLHELGEAMANAVTE